MGIEEYFNKVRDFLEQREISKRALERLNDDVEVAIQIEKLECTYRKENKNPKFEKRKAKNPDLIFNLSPEAIDVLLQYHGNSVGEFGIEVAKQYLAGGVKIQVVGPITNILTRGYLGVAKEGGLEFTKFLASHGLTGITKWSALIQKLKKQA